MDEKIETSQKEPLLIDGPKDTEIPGSNDFGLKRNTPLKLLFSIYLLS